MGRYNGAKIPILDFFFVFVNQCGKLTLLYSKGRKNYFVSSILAFKERENLMALKEAFIV